MLRRAGATLFYQGCRGLAVRNLQATAGENTGTQRLFFLEVHRATLDNLHVDGQGAGSTTWTLWHWANGEIVPHLRAATCRRAASTWSGSASSPCTR